MTKKSKTDKIRAVIEDLMAIARSYMRHCPPFEITTWDDKDVEWDKSGKTGRVPSAKVRTVVPSKVYKRAEKILAEIDRPDAGDERMLGRKK